MYFPAKPWINGLEPLNLCYLNLFFAHPSLVHNTRNDIFCIDGIRVGERIDVNDLAAVQTKGTPAANKAHVVGTGKNSQAGSLQGHCNMLTGRVVTDILITF